MLNEDYDHDALPDDPLQNSESRTRSENDAWCVTAAVVSMSVIFALAYVMPMFVQHTDDGEPTLRTVFVNFVLFHVAGFTAIVLVLVSRWPSGRRVQRLYLDRPLTWPLFGRAVLTTALVVPIANLIMLGILLLMEGLGLQASQNQIVEWMATASPEIMIMLAIGAVTLAPFVEEVMFRLVMFRAFRIYLGESGATVLTSLLFAIIHFIPEQIVPLFFLAIVLQRVMNREQNLWLPIAIHAMFNGFAVAMSMVYRMVH